MPPDAAASSAGAAGSGPLRAWEVRDPATWDAFVESAPYRSFPQLWAWGELRRGFGWQPFRLAVGSADGAPLAGAQLLLRHVPGMPWQLGYVPRGPLGRLDEPHVRDGLWLALRNLADEHRLATIKVDPEATAAAPYGAALLQRRWRAAHWVQPPRTRVIDLLADEEDLFAALAKKHRQYVRKAERDGVRVEWIDQAAEPAVVDAALTEFHAIYAHTARRAGFVERELRYYRGVWELFAPAGHARIGFATLDSERVAALFHFRCGDRAAEAYGGMTDVGAASHANYLLKWEAIRSYRAAGCAVYDLWGLATGGIARFKEGFGGRELTYVGARDWPLRPLPDALLRGLLASYGVVQRARLRLAGRRLAGTGE